MDWSEWERELDEWVLTPLLRSLREDYGDEYVHDLIFSYLDTFLEKKEHDDEERVLL